VVICGADIDGPLQVACTALAEERPASATHRAGDGRVVVVLLRVLTTLAAAFSARWSLSLVDLVPQRE